MPLIHTRTKSWEAFVVWLILISAIGGVSLLMINSTYARMYADDFCYAVNFDQLGFPGAGLFFYRDWSARFFSNFLVMGFADRPKTIIYLEAATIISLFFSLFVSLRHLPAKKRWLYSVTLALFFMLTIAISAPDFYKSFFWTGSALVLFPIFIMAPIFLAVVLNLIRAETETSRWLVLLGAVLSFCIATTHEVATLGWLLLNCAGLFWSAIQKTKNKSLNQFLIASALATLIGLAVMLFSPGIDNRAQIQHYPGTTPLAQTVLISIRNFFEFLQNIANPYYSFEGNQRPGWLLILGLCGLGWVMDFPLSRNWRSSFFLLCLTMMIILASFVPGAYVFRANIPLRSQMIPVFYLASGAFLLGTTLPKPKNKPLSSALILLVTVSTLLGMRVVIPRLLSIIEPLQSYARAWDARDRQFTGSASIPPRILIPWDAYEQNIHCIEMYYMKTDRPASRKLIDRQY
jgi:ABC-type iron transport system FetAB permease component